jgi:hypothetical protein
MTLQTPRPLEQFRAQTAPRALRGLVDEIRSGEMTLDPPYQRGSVWTPDKRVALIRSLMQGVPIPSLITSDRSWHGWTGPAVGGDGPVVAVIDGRQRLETMIAWFDSTLAVPASWWPVKDIVSTVDTDDGAYVVYSGLDRTAQLHFSHSAVMGVCEARVADIAAEAAIFCLVNGEGVPVDPWDLCRAATVAGRDSDRLATVKDSDPRR